VVLAIVSALFGALVDVLRPRASLVAEILVLRQQLAVLKRARRASPDFAVFPLAFLWRHCIELSLKEIIAVGRRQDGGRWGFPEHHRLLDLWNAAKPYVIQTGPDGDVGPAVSNVEANIVESTQAHKGSATRSTIPASAVSRTRRRC
jgi:hypothetical protein